ncbi:MAG: hypothetical protein A3H35_04595 [Betaproteobacteria bacterium RIFCSPLOWO2_02_FULL_62_17]|nr:MAG: hypothetical protein A3H35_04595 [Betaproteobacteria bacterium RIFCSPLOWO2_02_FULL_62_17]
MSLVALFSLTAFNLPFSKGAQAQAYPSKTVRWLIPSSPGGAFDIMTRGLAPAVSEQMGQTFFVDNIGGAGGNIALQTVARAEPDGYTILTAGTSQLVFNRFFYNDPGFDAMTDFKGVAQLGDLPIALWAYKSVPVTNFKELVAYMKANPGKLNYGSSGIGHLFHLGMAMLDDKIGIRAVHVPYKGVGPAVRDFLSGRLELIFSVAQRPVMAAWKAGDIRPLVGGTDRRLKQLPDVPTFNEEGIPGMDIPNWVGLVVPAAVPPEIVTRLNREVLKATESPVAVKTYQGMAMDVVKSTPEEFEEKYKREIRQWGPFIGKLGIKPQ